MALQGTLDTFALADLVRLLATTGKTGELSIDGDRGPGRLWFADGQLVGGEPAADDLTDVVFALLRSHDGDFAFNADTGPDDAQEPRSALDVLAAAEARIEEWAPVEALVPSPAVGLTLREELPGDSVTLDGETWRRLVAVAGGTTAGGFGERLGLDEQAAAFAIRDLVEAGLVEVDDEVVADQVVEPAVAPLAAVLPVVDVAAPYDFGGWGGAITEPEPTLVPEPEPVVPAPADLGSYAVDLDSSLGGDLAGHTYLGSSPSAGLPEPLLDALPEPLLEGPPPIDPAPAAEPDDGAGPAGTGAPGDLGGSIDSLSPAAARALAAAAAGDDEPDDTDAGRRVLRRIISTGKG